MFKVASKILGQPQYCSAVVHCIAGMPFISSAFCAIDYGLRVFTGGPTELLQLERNVFLSNSDIMAEKEQSDMNLFGIILRNILDFEIILLLTCGQM